MKTMATIVEQQNRIMIRGELNFQTVVALWKNSLPILALHPSIDINLSEVTNSNSAGLALLIEWLKYAKTQNKKIIFSDMPSQLQSLASVAGLSSILLP